MKKQDTASVPNITNFNFKYDSEYLFLLTKVVSKEATKEEIALLRSMKPRIDYQLNLIETSMSDASATSDNRLYYYVDLTVFINNIVEKGNSPDKKISILAGHCDYLNDKDEFNNGYKIINEAKAIDNSVKDNIKKYKDNVPFVICFSLAKDNLPMWHIYAKNAGGVMLCFDMKKIQNRKMGQLKQVIYDNTEEYAAFVDLIVDPERYFTNKSDAKITSNKLVFQKALEWFPFLAKNGNFEYEKEIRLTRISWDNDNPDQSHLYLNKGGLLCPYRKIYFPADFLKEIYLSPYASNDQTEYSLRKFLDQNGLKNVIIKRSCIPYRG